MDLETIENHFDNDNKKNPLTITNMGTHILLRESMTFAVIHLFPDISP